MNVEKKIWLECQGDSMYPFLKNQDELKIVCDNEYKIGNIVAYEHNEELIVHRIIDIRNNSYIIIGDNMPLYEDVVKKEKIWGNVVSLRRNKIDVSLDRLTIYTSMVMVSSYITFKIRCFFGKRNKFGSIICKIIHLIINPILRVIYNVEKYE